MKKKNTKKIEAAKEDRLPREEVPIIERVNTKKSRTNQMHSTKNRREKIQIEGLREMIYLMLELSHQAEEIYTYERIQSSPPTKMRKHLGPQASMLVITSQGRRKENIK